MKKILSLFSIVIVLFFAGCEDRTELTAPSTTVNTGTADFSRFYSIGNSITAGYQSGSLYESAQKYSFGNLIANQVGTTYAFPNYSDPGTPGRIEIVKITATGLVTRINPASGIPTNKFYSKPYNNLGVPGATLYDVLYATDSLTCQSYVSPYIPLPAPYLKPNPMFNLILRNTTTPTTQLSQGLSQTPTFLTIWIGNNDVLGYATSGGVLPPIPTPVSKFNENFDSLANKISTYAPNAKVVLGNIPDVTVIPFFTTIGGQLMLAGKTAVWAIKGTGDTALLPLTGNLLTLKAQEELYNTSGVQTGKGFSKSMPLSSIVVLDSAEIVTAQTAIANFNGKIASVASAKGWGLVDVNTIFRNFEYNPLKSKTGMMVNGIQFSTMYVLGNLFSMDGVHPTNQGQAIIANEFIKVVNSKFGAAIPLINVATIPGGLPFAKSINRSNIGIPLFPAGTFDNLLF